MTLTDLSLVRRNKVAFRKHHPATLDALGFIGECASSPVVVDGVLQNIRVTSEQDLYPAPAREWTDGQVKGFLHQPPRMAFLNASHCNLSDVSLKVWEHLIDHIGHKAVLEGAPVVDSGYAFVFGVGLGYHIEQLIDALKVREMVLVEPVPEFLLHSMCAIDWGRIFRKAERKGIRLHFVMDEDPATNVRSIEKILLACSTDFLDGSYFYFHYYSWSLEQTNSLFTINLQHHKLSSGFFEDELKMMRNAAANITAHGFRIVESKTMVEQAAPVFIVGSGPSIDNDLPYIKKWRSKAVLISCGTALGILLRNGLRPDIHIEMENGPQIYPILSKLREEYGFQGIALACSITVHEENTSLFDERWFFFRSGLSAFKLLSGPHMQLYGSDPTVANGAFSVAAACGFRQVYLFGIDCGYKMGAERHHSKESIYYLDKSYKDYNEEIAKQHDRVLPGNFGGTFKTQWTFDLTARGIGETKRQFRRMELFNCADGARILGANPKAAESIDLSGSTADPNTAMARVRAQLSAYEAGELLQYAKGEELIAGIDIYEEALTNFFRSVKAEPKTEFWPLRMRLSEVCDGLPDECRGIRAMGESALFNLLRAVAFYGTRMTKASRRHDLIAFAMGEMEEMLKEMCQRTRIHFRQLLVIQSVPQSVEV